MTKENRTRGRLFRTMVLPVGLAMAFLGYLASELALEGRWISKLIFDHNWAESIRVASFAIAAVLIWLVSRLRYSEYLQSLEYEQRYEAILENSINGMIIHRDGRILFMNGSARRTLGFEDRPVCDGKTAFADIVDPRDRGRIRKLGSLRDSDSPVDLTYECRFLGRDGEVVWAQISSFVIQHGGKPAVLININDISEGKRAEEQLVHSTRLAELGEMAASIAHELNQPLTGIKNFADSAVYMMENDAGGASDVIENLQLIREQVDRASRIITQMQDLSRRSGREFAPVELNGLVEECVDFLGHQLTNSQIVLRTSLGKGLPRVCGDRIRLTQVLLNILTNARQAMEDEERRELTIVTGSSEDKGAVYVRISDTGPGFTAEQKNKIFSPFFSTKKPGRGTGLGLSISLTIVEEHNGWIETEGTPGEGAVFTVFLPASGGASRDGGDHVHE